MEDKPGLCHMIFRTSVVIQQVIKLQICTWMRRFSFVKQHIRFILMFYLPGVSISPNPMLYKSIFTWHFLIFACNVSLQACRLICLVSISFKSLYGFDRSQIKFLMSLCIFSKIRTHYKLLTNRTTVKPILECQNLKTQHIWFTFWMFLRLPVSKSNVQILLFSFHWSFWSRLSSLYQHSSQWRGQTPSNLDCRK